MNSGTLQNAVLANLQQSELVNFGAGFPNWSAVSDPTAPPITQDYLVFNINRAYAKAIQDLADVQLSLYRLVYPSLANTSDYPLPPLQPPQYGTLGGSVLGTFQLNSEQPPESAIWGQAQWGNFLWGTIVGAPRIQRITRIIYSPVGQSWSQDMEGGVRLVSWQEFQRKTAFGYLRPFTYGIMPDYAAMSPDRTVLSFFPGSASAGDSIGIEYIPELTPGTNVAPFVVNSFNDPTFLPDEAADLIITWASYLCCPKLALWDLRQQFYFDYYGDGTAAKPGELNRLKDQLQQRSLGDSYCIRDANDGLALSYIIGGALIP